ncbi:hypothetical protein [Sphingobacterium sp. UBA5980]|uniref:hypothetical protein n=1 Tax=Sphingobacterium sp. UBA5980 TaxID=1947504 RepID=UPI0025800995|nr:hypothetical protein [Sphingobacterium sp. UBA5980]
MVSPEIREAQVILEKGSRFEVPAPFFLRLFRKKTITFTLHDPTAAICLELTAMRLSMGVTDEEFEKMSVEGGLKMIVEHGETVARMIALGILRGKTRNWLFGKWLANRLLSNYPFSTLMDMMHILTLGSGLQDFINIIGLLKAIRLTKPNESDPSQKET